MKESTKRRNYGTQKTQRNSKIEVNLPKSKLDFQNLNSNIESIIAAIVLYIWRDMGWTYLHQPDIFKINITHRQNVRYQLC